MTTFVTYELKVALLLIVCFSAYSLLLRHDTWFRLRRLVLLASVALSFLLPLCVIKVHKVQEVDFNLLSSTNLAMEGNMTMESVTNGWLGNVCQGIVFLIIVGMLLMMARMIVELYKLHDFMHQIEMKKEENGVSVCLTDEMVSPFSYMKYVVMSKSDYLLRRQAIMTHEQSHIAHHHTFDLFFVNLALVVQWFNPAMWMLRNELVKVHEYEADEDVVNSGICTDTYFHLLMDKATRKVVLTFANAFGEKGMLRNRIEMLASRRSSGKARLKALYLVPIIAISLAVSAKTITDYKIIGNPRPESPKTVDSAKNAKEENKLDVNNSADDNVLYYVNSSEIDLDDLENIDPSSVEEVNIVKASGKKPSIEVDDKQPEEVYVDLTDTIIKKGEDGTYEMYSEDFDFYDEMKKQLEKDMADFQNQKIENEEQGRQTVEDAQKQRSEALEKARKSRVEAEKRRSEALEQARKARVEAVKRRAEAMKQREEAMKQAEQALKESEKALKESQKALKESERILKEQNKSLERKKKEYAIVEDTIKYMVHNNNPDSSTIRLYVSSDGSISNLNAYKIDTINGNNYVVISMNAGTKQIVSLYRSLKSKV